MSQYNKERQKENEIMISINNEPLIDMMKTINHKFIEDHNNRIRIEPTKHSIIVKYIRDPECSIRDIIMVFNGDGIVEITGLRTNGTYEINQYDITAFIRDSNLFRTLLHKNFFDIDKKDEV